MTHDEAVVKPAPQPGDADPHKEPTPMGIGGFFGTEPSGDHERQYSQGKIRKGTGWFNQGQIATP